MVLRFWIIVSEESDVYRVRGGIFENLNVFGSRLCRSFILDWSWVRIGDTNGGSRSTLRSDEGLFVSIENVTLSDNWENFPDVQPLWERILYVSGRSLKWLISMGSLISYLESSFIWGVSIDHSFGFFLVLQIKNRQRITQALVDVVSFLRIEIYIGNLFLKKCSTVKYLSLLNILSGIQKSEIDVVGVVSTVYVTSGLNFDLLQIFFL